MFDTVTTKITRTKDDILITKKYQKRNNINKITDYRSGGLPISSEDTSEEDGEITIVTHIDNAEKILKCLDLD